MPLLTPLSVLLLLRLLSVRSVQCAINVQFVANQFHVFAILLFLLHYGIKDLPSLPNLLGPQHTDALIYQYRDNVCDALCTLWYIAIYLKRIDFLFFFTGDKCFTFNEVQSLQGGKQHFSQGCLHFDSLCNSGTPGCLL